MPFGGVRSQNWVSWKSLRHEPERRTFSEVFRKEDFLKTVWYLVSYSYGLERPSTMFFCLGRLSWGDLPVDWSSKSHIVKWLHTEFVPCMSRFVSHLSHIHRLPWTFCEAFQGWYHSSKRGTQQFNTHYYSNIPSWDQELGDTKEICMPLP